MAIVAMAGNNSGAIPTAKASAISVLQQYLINKWATIKEEKIEKSI
jgi:hypothetical protein